MEEGHFKRKSFVDGVAIRSVKWFDNRRVIAAQLVSNVKKWDRKLKQEVSVECPSIIKFMGTVDAIDALIAYYRIQIR